MEEKMEEKPILEMSSEEYFVFRKDMNNITEKEFNEKWEEFASDMKDMIPEGETPAHADITKYCIRRFQSYFAKQDRNPTYEFMLVPIGINVSDYGALSMYNAAKALYKDDPTEALDEGLVNEKGEPIFTKPDWKRGDLIIPEEAMTKQTIGKAIKKDSDEYQEAQLNIRGGDIDVADTPLFTKLKVRVSVGKEKEGKPLGLFYNKSSKIEVGEKMSFEEAKKYLAENYPEGLTTISKLGEYHDKNADNFNRIAIVIGDVCDLIITDGIKSNVLALNDPNATELKTVTCWVPKSKELDLNFDMTTQDVIAIGRTAKNQETGEVSMNLYGLYVKPEFVISEKPIKMTESNDTEKPKESVKDEKVW